RGGRVDIDAGTYDLVFLGGGADGETRVGGHLALGPEEANVGIAYMERKDENDQRAVWSLTAEAEPLEDWSLRMEGALGINNGLTSRAVFFNTKIDTISYFLNVEALSVGTDFPGLHADEAGIGLSQRLRIEDLSLGTSLSHMWDNVIRDPLVSTTITDELGLNFYVTPLEEGPTITSTVGFTWERGEDLSVKNEIERLLSVAMSDTQGEFPYSFSAKLTDRIDHVANTHYRTLSFSEGVGLSIEDFDLFLKLTQEKTEDYLTGDLLTGGTDVSLRFSSNSSLHSATITLANAKDWFDLTLEVDVLLLEDLHVLLDTTLGWDRADATASTLSLGMSFDLGFKLPIPFLVTKARIEGRVYDDSNANGQCDQGEKGILGLLLALADTQALTGEDGQFRFPPLLPGDYSLRIVNLPFPYVPPAS
ncbi:carboxypeptidase regulatory-like domain-containing protein, partial [Candidatus Bipolaricaulota bacterium]|nr:carboxypeptidase regulatory-like domain-containing protein [Candidatus Bipolaricaulota bacterium]